MSERKIVIPGEIIASGEEFLPGEGTEKENNDIVARRFGLAEISGSLVKIIPLSGIYHPRKGNVVIGKVENITLNGWVINIDAPDFSFLPLSEVPRFINKDEIEETMSIGDVVVAKILSINSRGIDLTIRGKGLGKIDEGLIMKVNPNKVPRIIGREGSMVNLIKEKTKCNITVGQNGWIWIKGNSIDDETKAKNTIEFIINNSYKKGLTEKVEEIFESAK